MAGLDGAILDVRQVSKWIVPPYVAAAVAPQVSVRRQCLGVAFPAFSCRCQRAHHVILRNDTVERIAFDSGDGGSFAYSQLEVVGQRGMGVSEILRGQPVRVSQAVQIWHAGVSNHSVVAVVLFDNHKHVCKLRDAASRGSISARATDAASSSARRQSHRKHQAYKKAIAKLHVETPTFAERRRRTT